MNSSSTTTSTRSTRERSRVRLERKWRDRPGEAVELHRAEQSERRDDLGLSNSPTHVAHVNVIAPLGGPGFSRVSSSLLERAANPRRQQRRWRGHVANLTFYKQRMLPRGLDLSASLYTTFSARTTPHPASEEFRQDTLAQDGRTARVWLTVNFPARTN